MPIVLFFDLQGSTWIADVSEVYSQILMVDYQISIIFDISGQSSFVHRRQVLKFLLQIMS